MAAGIGSFKIEGRMKSAFYTATVVKAYREAIDAAWAGTWDETDLHRWDRELASVSNRGFTTGFLLGQPGEAAQRTDRGGYDRTADFVAAVPEDAVCEPVTVSNTNAGNGCRLARATGTAQPFPADGTNWSVFAPPGLRYRLTYWKCVMRRVCCSMPPPIRKCRSLPFFPHPFRQAR